MRGRGGFGIAWERILEYRLAIPAVTRSGTAAACDIIIRGPN